MSDNLPIMKRKRATLLSNITRFVTAINDAMEGTTPDDLEHFRNRLHETLDQLTSLDDSPRFTEWCRICHWRRDLRGIIRFGKTCHLQSSTGNRLCTIGFYVHYAPRHHYATFPYNHRAYNQTQPSSWNHFRATLSRGRVFGSSFSRPWTQTLLSHRLTSMSF